MMTTSTAVKPNSMRARVLLLVLVVVLFMFPIWITVPYYIHLLVLTGIWIVLTQGLNLIQGYTGYVSLSHATFFGIGAYSSAILTTRLGLPIYLGIICGVLIGAVFGFVIGWPVLRTRGHYFAIATLAVSVIGTTVMENWRAVTGGDDGLMGIPSIRINVPGLQLTARETFYYLALIAALVAIWLVHRIATSRLGWAMVMVRENERMAEAVGVNPRVVKVIAFVLSAAFAAFAGGLYAHYSRFINPTPFALDASLDGILAVILGGSGVVWGPIVGSALVVFLPEYLRLAAAYRLVIYGVLLVLTTILMPEGIVVTVSRFGRSLLQRWRTNRTE